MAMLRTPLASALFALTCLSLAAGCAHGPGGFGGRWFSWVRPSARTQAEIEHAKAAKAAEELEHPERVHLAHAQWREQCGDFAAARSSYEYVLTHEPDSIEALIGVARIDQMSGRFDEAERGFRKALDIRPSSPLALNALGQFYAAEERWDAAVPLLRSAAQAEPDDPKYQHHLGIALARSGHADEALPHFTRSVGAAEAHYNVAYLLHEQGQDGLAVDHLQTALRMKPDLRTAADLLAELTGMPARTPHGMVPAGRLAQQPQPLAKVTRIPVTEIRQTGSEVYEQSKARYAEPAAYHVDQTPPPLTAPPTRPGGPAVAPVVHRPMSQPAASQPAASLPAFSPPAASVAAPVVATQPAATPAAIRPAPTGSRSHGSAQQEQRANQRPAP